MYDRKRSLHIAWSFDDFEPRQCWYFAIRVLRDPSYKLQHAFYVEGHCMNDKSPGVYFAHGWLELPDGTIIDPTRAGIELYLECEQSFTDSRTYYPLRKYTKAELKGKRLSQFPLNGGRELTKQEMLLLFGDDGYQQWMKERMEEGEIPI